jgi:hypothetical protein
LLQLNKTTNLTLHRIGPIWRFLLFVDVASGEPTMTAAPITSAGRRSPLGPFGIQLSQ